EFKQKTLPSAKYFDDHRLLHLIPGEKDDQTIFERMKELVRKAMCTGVPVFVSNSSKDHDQREECEKFFIAVVFFEFGHAITLQMTLLK
ncbi:hypothetical protein NECAME_16949, partial [Necator americanus]